jgi:hypothetical protein
LLLRLRLEAKELALATGLDDRKGHQQLALW